MASPFNFSRRGAAFVFLVALVAAVLSAGCRPEPPETIPLPTKICVRTQHHHQPIPRATVYVKFNADSFPGYDRPAAFFDAVFTTGADARGCLESVPEGRHWLVGYGYDSLYFPHDVKGSLRIDISLRDKPVLDTILYISEEH